MSRIRPQPQCRANVIVDEATSEMVRRAMKSVGSIARAARKWGVGANVITAAMDHGSMRRDTLARLMACAMAEPTA